MADITSQISIADSVRTGVGRWLTSLMGRLEAYSHVRSRRDRIDALEARSDAELAQMGLKREDIVRHVFRDLYYV
ncbi:MAG: protein of unknown function containing DUF1127 domain [Rhodobacteraceae bacterium HLUCCO07]|uniref:hypothetical protein n=1 Tax=Aquicoccus sp. TaxID=2055851 RepID=UPI0006DBB7FE|nr:MAG: protein of unknown function containing DUF1127 domain [Rhodobacteraceae bacterium HLUCCO07]